MEETKLTIEQRLLLDIYNVLGGTTDKDIPDFVLRKRIFLVWDDIQDYLERRDISLKY